MADPSVPKLGGQDSRYESWWTTCSSPDCGRLALATCMLLSLKFRWGKRRPNHPVRVMLHRVELINDSAKAFPCWLRSGRGRSHSKVEVHNLLLPVSARSSTSRWEDKCFHPAAALHQSGWQNRVNHIAWMSKQWKDPTFNGRCLIKTRNSTILTSKEKRHHQKHRQHRGPYQAPSTERRDAKQSDFHGTSWTSSQTSADTGPPSGRIWAET